jgi:hypothetical protein
MEVDIPTAIYDLNIQRREWTCLDRHTIITIRIPCNNTRMPAQLPLQPSPARNIRLQRGERNPANPTHHTTPPSAVHETTLAGGVLHPTIAITNIKVPRRYLSLLLPTPNPPPGHFLPLQVYCVPIPLLCAMTLPNYRRSTQWIHSAI